MENNRKKVVLAIAGHDPTGAAGIQADIESISAAGCQCVSVITALTIQNTTKFAATIPQDPDNLKKQCKTLLSDVYINSCKVGLLGDIGIAKAVSEVIDEFRDISIVLDPVLRAGSGEHMTNGNVIEFIRNDLLKKTTVLTPNRAEAYLLTGQDDILDAGENLIELGCNYVLITGADENTSDVINVLFSQAGEPVSYEWERLPGKFHGSGCTLSASIAARLAKDSDIVAAIEDSQEYTWETLKHGIQTGRDQKHPNRFY